MAKSNIIIEFWLPQTRPILSVFWPKKNVFLKHLFLTKVGFQKNVALFAKNGNNKKSKKDKNCSKKKICKKQNL